MAELDATQATRTPARPRAALGVAAAILYIFLWSSAFVPSRVLSRAASPLWVLSIRFLIAGALLLAFARARGARLPDRRQTGLWLRLALLGITGNAIYLGCTYFALRRLTAGMAAILASTNPLFLALVAPWLLRERLTPRKAAGLLLGFGGVLLAMHARAGSHTADPRDVALALAGVLGVVAQAVIYKRLRERPHPLVLNGVQLLAGGLAVTPLALAFAGPPALPATVPVLASMAWLIVVMSGLGALLWFWILNHNEASRVSAWYFLSPLFGLGLGALLLGEPLLPLDLASLVVVAVGLRLVATA